MGRRNKKAKLKRAAALSAAQAKRSKVKAGKCKTTTTSKSQGIARKYNVDDLLDKVDECLDTFQVELAVKFAERALDIAPESTRVLDTLAPLLLEIGQVDKALECFQRCISLSPESGHAKYLYMGQLTSGEEAIAYLTKGLEIMEGTLGGRKRETGAAPGLLEDVTNEEVSTAYCTLAEIYLTDSCFVEAAGEKCYRCCSKAIELSPSNPEAHQLLASCLLSQGKEEDAKTSLMRGISLWLPSKVGGASSSSDGGASVAAPPLSASSPPYFSRMSAAKLLIEVKEYDAAFEVLEGLLHEDDEVVGVWYLMGWLHHITEDADSARFYLEQTKALFTKLECDETEILEHTVELLRELGPGGSTEQTAEMEGEGEGEEDCIEDSDNELAKETETMEVS